ncbi:MBL fold metallo-hydrolase [bacterium]|nr:MBL fold metallo-hydrolase [bacterium]
MQIGKFKITPLELGHFRLDGGAMFGVIPRKLWQKHHPADENNTIDMVMRCMLIEVGNRKILVDTGFGEGRPEKFKKIYNYNYEINPVHEALKVSGLTTDDITDVIITHLHFDHNGGSTKNKAATPEPTFANARYYLQKKQVEHARTRFERDKASYFPEDFEPLIEAGVATIVDGEWELMDGIDCIICNGHTPAQQLPRVRDKGQTLIYAADLIPLASQFPLPWIMSYDLEPVETLEEKRRILTKAAEEEWIFFFEHDPSHITGRVVKSEKGFALEM